MRILVLEVDNEGAVLAVMILGLEVDNEGAVVVVIITLVVEVAVVAAIVKKENKRCRSAIRGKCTMRIEKK